METDTITPFELSRELCPLQEKSGQAAIAAAVGFLAMNRASSIAGHNIVIDGGATNKIL